MGRLFFLGMFAISFWGCGSEREVEPKTPLPTPKPTPGPGGETDFTDVQAITSQFCVRCHSTSQFLKSETAWRSSEAKARVGNSSMPPPATNEARNITAADRAVLVNF